MLPGLEQHRTLNGALTVFRAQGSQLQILRIQDEHIRRVLDDQRLLKLDIAGVAQVIRETLRKFLIGEPLERLQVHRKHVFRVYFQQLLTHNRHGISIVQRHFYLLLHLLRHEVELEEHVLLSNEDLSAFDDARPRRPLRGELLIRDHLHH